MLNSQTIFSVPQTPSATSEYQEVQLRSPSAAFTLDSSGSELKKRRSKQFGYVPVFESNIFIDSSDTHNLSATQTVYSLQTTPVAKKTSLEARSPTSQTLDSCAAELENTVTNHSTLESSHENSNTNGVCLSPIENTVAKDSARESSAMIISNLVLPRQPDLFNDKENLEENKSKIDPRNASSSKGINHVRTTSRNEYNASHGRYVNSFQTNQLETEKVTMNLNHILSIQDRLKYEPSYDSSFNETARTVLISSSPVGRQNAPAEIPNHTNPKMGVDEAGKDNVEYRQRAPNRRLFNNQLRMSWELPPSPPPTPPPNPPSPDLFEVNHADHLVCLEARDREIASSVFMRCVGEDLRNIADQFEESSREVRFTYHN